MPSYWTRCRGSKLALLHRVKERKTPSLSAHASFAPFSLKVAWSGKSLIYTVTKYKVTFMPETSLMQYVLQDTWKRFGCIQLANKDQNRMNILYCCATIAKWPIPLFKPKTSNGSDWYLTACLSACLPVCLSAFLPFCLSACLPVCLCVFVSVCLSVCLPVFPSICLCLCLFPCICVSACFDMPTGFPVCLPAYLLSTGEKEPLMP